MAESSHPCILQLKAVYETPKHIDVVTEHAPGGELFDLIVERQRFTEDDARVVLHQVFRAVAYLHSRGIAHRDLKVRKIFFLKKKGFTLIFENLFNVFFLQTIVFFLK